MTCTECRWGSCKLGWSQLQLGDWDVWQGLWYQLQFRAYGWDTRPVRRVRGDLCYVMPASLSNSGDSCKVAPLPPSVAIRGCRLLKSTCWYSQHTCGQYTMILLVFMHEIAPGLQIWSFKAELRAHSGRPLGFRDKELNFDREKFP